MGYELISQPQIFLAPITAVNGIQGVNEAYPLLTTYQSWTSTAVIDSTVFPIPGIWTMLNESGSFLVTVGGVLQPSSEYTVSRDFRTLTFNSPVSAGVEIAVQQLATAAPSSQEFNYVKAVSGTFTTLSAQNIVDVNNINFVSSSVFPKSTLSNLISALAIKVNNTTLYLPLLSAI